MNHDKAIEILQNEEKQLKARLAYKESCLKQEIEILARLQNEITTLNDQITNNEASITALSLKVEA